MHKRGTQGAATITRTELLVGGDDTAFRNFLYDFFTFSQQLESVRAKFASYIGLSPIQYMILIAISRMAADEEAGINQVATHLHVSGAFVTIEANRLAKLGLIAKEAHPSDGRRVVVRITEKGNDRLLRLAEFQRPVNDALFGALTSSDFDVMRAAMARLAAHGETALNLAKFLESDLTTKPIESTR